MAASTSGRARWSAAVDDVAGLMKSILAFGLVLHLAVQIDLEQRRGRTSSNSMPCGLSRKWSGSPGTRAEMWV
jgi:hypothetical protein